MIVVPSKFNKQKRIKCGWFLKNGTTEDFWELPYFHAVNLGLERHIEFDKNGY
jgi:hypothetical protein